MASPRHDIRTRIRDEPSSQTRRLISTGRDIRREGGLHTLYISPLKALAVDIARNLERPVAEMALPIRIETRTGDTPASKRQRQRRDPPHILLTTPEQLALILASPDAPFLFGSLRRIVLDELHSLVVSKRGDLLSLGLARLFTLAPGLTSVGLSATVAVPDDLRRYLVPQRPGGGALADLVIADAGAAPDVQMLDTAERLPWAGHSAHHAINEIYGLIKRHKTTLVFVNTRSQAESIFQELWGINDDGLAIALHHGSLDVAQRRKVEAAMAVGRLRAVVATSSLDLGIDWGDVDLVINVGAPKGASRLLQRIGRANHRMDEPSKGVLIPANRFEVLECTAALGAVAENAQDTPAARIGALDVLAQHVLGSACGEAFLADELYAEVTGAAPYASLTRADFDAVLDYVATGGYALKAYERFAKIRQGKDGRWRVTHPMIAQRYRMNVGTIVEADMLKVRLVRSRASKMIPRGGRILGEVEEYFIEMLTPGDTFVFAGEILRYEAMMQDEVYVSRANSEDPKVPPTRAGNSRFRPIWPIACAGSFPIDANGERCPARCASGWKSRNGARACLVNANCWSRPSRVPTRPISSAIHSRDGLHTRPSACCSPAGWNGRGCARSVSSPTNMRWRSGGWATWRRRSPAAASRSMRCSTRTCWATISKPGSPNSALMKRTFRTCAIIAGLIERRFPGKEKSRREVTISTDLVYDVLRKHQGDHILLRAARADAATGLLDIRRLGEMLSRIRGRIVHKALDHLSPLAVPVMLEIGRESVYGEASEGLLAEAEAELVKEAMR